MRDEGKQESGQSLADGLYACGGPYKAVEAAVRRLVSLTQPIEAERAARAEVIALDALSEAQRRHQAVEAALRHARGIVASEISDLRAMAANARHLCEDPRVTARGKVSARERAGRLTAQADEREQWIASWDAALR